MTMRGSLLKRAYRIAMDWLEEITIRESLCPRLVCNLTEGIQETRTSSSPIQASPPTCSRLTSPVSHRNHVSCIQVSISVRTSGRTISRMKTLLRFHHTCYHIHFPVSYSGVRNRPTVLSFNRFEKKKNVALAIDPFALFKQQLGTTLETQHSLRNPRLIVGGCYDSRVEENMMTLMSLVSLVNRTKAASLTETIITPSSSKTTIPPFNMTHKNPDIICLLNFTTSQHAALLFASSTLALHY